MIGFERGSFTVQKKPSLPTCFPANTTIESNLIISGSKDELLSVLFGKGIQTINAVSKSKLVYSYADGSAEETIQNGDVGAF